MIMDNQIGGQHVQYNQNHNHSNIQQIPMQIPHHQQHQQQQQQMTPMDTNQHQYPPMMDHQSQHYGPIPTTIGPGVGSYVHNTNTQQQQQEQYYSHHPQQIQHQHSYSMNPPQHAPGAASLPPLPPAPGPNPDKTAIKVVLSFLKKHNLKGTEEILKREANVSESELKGSGPSDAEVHSVLSQYASDENPDEYTDAYCQLKNFIDSSLDNYKYEVGQILWPVFVHMYLELVYNEHEAQAKGFFSRFSLLQETFHDEDLAALGSLTKKQDLNTENIFKPLSMCLTNPKSIGKGQGTKPSGVGQAGDLYVVRMSREAQSLLKRFLQEKRLRLVHNIVQERIFVEVYDGGPRGKTAINAISGHFMGEACRQDNKTKVYFGLLREPDLQNVQMDENDEESSSSAAGTGGTKGTGTDSSSKGGEDSSSSAQTSTTGSTSGQGPADPKTTPSKKKKSKKDWLLSKKGKNDPNAPPLTRMPLPELRDIEKMEKAKALRESAKRVTLSAERLPSICMYTLLNSENIVCCIKWSDDGSLLSIGFSNSMIKLWSMTPVKLKKLKSATDLSDIDREADDVLVRMMDDRTGEIVRTLWGHSGPVYSMDFSLDKATLLSSSEDTTIRLWNLLTWSCVVVYKGHLFPVWKVAFSPHGYYFASAGHDRTARLWATDNSQPLRLFAGHYSDVTSVVFHPNSNYVATGSSDRSVRLWDCVNGSCVRLMTGHKASIDNLLFSNDGRFLASSGIEPRVLLWDISNGTLLTILTLASGPVHSLAFSREGTVLATGGQDSNVKLWNFTRLVDELVSEDGAGAIPPDAKKINSSHLLIGEFPTKNIPIYGLHFTRRNVLLASGPFQS